MTVPIKAPAPQLATQKKTTNEETLSEEDAQLKGNLEMLVERLCEPNHALHQAALESLCTIMRSSTTSMTAVPKPLKFLRIHVHRLVRAYEAMPADSTKQFMADVLSVLHMTQAADEHEKATPFVRNAVLNFRLAASDGARPAAFWGHEYVKHLAMEVAAEFAAQSESDAPCETTIATLKTVALRQIVPFFMEHASEADACDLLYEIGQLDALLALVNEANFGRICRYLSSCIAYEPFPENVAVARVVFDVYSRMGRLCDALIVAVWLHDATRVEAAFELANAQPDAELLHRQFCHILARCGGFASERIFARISADCGAVLRGASFPSSFLHAAAEFELAEPRSPDDVFKAWLDARNTDAADSPKVVTAAAVVNGVVNWAFGRDKFLLNAAADPAVSNAWIYRGTDEAVLCAVASIGCILAGNVEEGLAALDPYLTADASTQPWVRAGALFAVGLLAAPGVRHESEPALALLSDTLTAADRSSFVLKESAILGLLAAYVGTNSVALVDLLTPLLTDTSVPLSTAALAAVALGASWVGSCNGDITSSVLQMLMERQSEFSSVASAAVWASFMALALGLLFLGGQEAADAAVEASRVLPPALSAACSTLICVCAYAGTGNVIEIQKLLHVISRPAAKCAESETDAKLADDDEAISAMLDQTFAVVGISLIALGEHIGSEMAFRIFNHVMFYGGPAVRKAVPLALALSYASNPSVAVIDVLAKYSHDSTKEVAVNAIVALGIVGCGTANARIASLLRGLACFYYKDAALLSIVKMSQGILHAARGIVSASPLLFERRILCRSSVAVLLTVFVALAVDAEQTVLGRYPHFVFLLTAAFKARIFTPIDAETLKPLACAVRVGTAVDVVGMAGNPKTLTGFQTQTTPVLLAAGERVELVPSAQPSDEKEALSPILEGEVILRTKVCRVFGDSK